MTLTHVTVATVLVASVMMMEPRFPWDQQDQSPVFRGTADGVRVDVSVRQRNRPVIGLKAADFELRDNDVPQEVIDLAYESAPIDITVALDISLSVDGVLLEQLRQSVRDLRDDLRPQDRLKLVSFNMRVLRQMPFTSDRREIEKALAALKGLGSTSVFDAIAVSLVAKAPPERRHLVMVFTDASDTSSITPSASLTEIALRSNAALGFVVGGTSKITRPDPPMLLINLARETGGQALSTKLGEDLSNSFKRLLDEFRSSYVLFFRPNGVDRSGLHVLTVRVKGVDTYEIRARRGYFK